MCLLSRVDAQRLNEAIAEIIGDVDLVGVG
jgi:hypothetical protein